MKSLILRLMLALFVVLAFSEARADAQSLVPLYQYKYSSGSQQDFFYTTNFAELGFGGNGWTYQGIAMRVYDSEASGTVKFYRFFGLSSGKHFYSTSPDEVGPPDWVLEGDAGWIYPPHSQPSGTVPIHRWYKWAGSGVAHYYVVHTGFDIDLYASGWVYEGVIGYAVAP